MILIDLFETPIAAGRALLVDPRFQFHLSVEPDLAPGQSFAEQTRTVSRQGERGDAGVTNGAIYSTHSPEYWSAQLAFEEVGTYPRFVYLVFVREATAGGDIWAGRAHQEVAPRSGVIVLAKVGESEEDSDDVPDFGRMRWIAERWITANGQEAINRFG